MSCHGPSRHPPVIWKCLFSPIGHHASWNIILVSQKMLTHAPNLSDWIVIRPGTTKVLWRIRPEASDPPVVAHRRRRHFRGNGLRWRRRHARKEIKGGDLNFLRLSRRSTAGCRDVYSSFNHTLGLWRGSTASLEDLRALYHVATHRKWGCQPVFDRKCERGRPLKGRGWGACVLRSLLLFRRCGRGDVRCQRGSKQGQHAIDKQHMKTTCPCTFASSSLGTEHRAA